MTFEPLAPLGGYITLSILLLGLVGYFFVKEIRTPGHDDASIVDWSRRLAITMLVIFIGFGPGRIEETTETARANVDVFFVVDRTGSMVAEDYDGDKPRLDGVRADINSLVSLLPGSRFGVISFDSSATQQLPLTTDTNALKIWSTNMNQEITLYSKGSTVNRARDEMARILADSKERFPQNQRLVFLMTDAENTTEDEVRKTFADLEPLVDGGAVLLYGTEAGGPMKQYDPYDLEPKYIEDHMAPGTPNAISKADLGEGKAIAAELGVGFFHLTEPTDLAPAVAGIDPEILSVEGGRIVEVFQLMIWPFAIGLAALLTWELSVVVARSARRVG